MLDCCLSKLFFSFSSTTICVSSTYWLNNGSDVYSDILWQRSLNDIKDNKVRALSMTSFIRQVSECPCAFPFDFLVFDHWKFIDVDVLLFIFCRSRSRSPRHRRSGGGHRRRSPDSRSPSPRSKYFSLMMQ